MKVYARYNVSIAMILAGILFLVACSSLAPAPVAGAPPTVRQTIAPPSPVALPTSRPLTPHRIGIRVVNGVGEFYDRETGQAFTPRGNNYIRLAIQQSILYHSTFNAGFYNPTEADEAMQSMRSYGYNVVRVFLTPNSLGDPTGGLSMAYVANLADFLERAKTNDIAVILTTDDIPALGGYIEIQDTTWSADFPGSHATFLKPGGILAEGQFWSDLVEALINQNAPLDNIFAYELRNEQFFFSDLPPLNLSSGIVKTANGKSYDMASADDKQRMIEEGLVYWIDSTRARILEQDPTALVTVGFFVPHGPNPARVGDPRLVVSAPAIWKSQADFIDLHPYPDAGLNLRQYVENFGMKDMQEKPILMGEFGAHRTAFASPGSAANAFMNWQVESCQYGFDGWLLWTWDLSQDPVFFHALDGNGEINQALAPINRPDPCQAQ